MRGATKRIAEPIHNSSISTHAPLAGRDLSRTEQENQHRISTHAPLAGRDHSNRDFKTMPRISTHAPLAGRDKSLPQMFGRQSEFQPTRPLRGATQEEEHHERIQIYFNPRAPCGARPRRKCGGSNTTSISTHAPLAGRDGYNRKGVYCSTIFQPTRPLRGATPAGG